MVCNSLYYARALLLFLLTPDDISLEAEITTVCSIDMHKIKLN